MGSRFRTTRPGTRPAALVAAFWQVVLCALATGCTSTAAGPLAESAESGAEASPEAAEAGQTCALETSYTFGNDGGYVGYQDESILAPTASYQHLRHNAGADADQPIASCAPVLPACNDHTRINLVDILRDMANADVQAALAANPPPVYGFDTRPADGIIFRFSRADGRGFFAGADCDGGTFCYGPVPAGVAQLEADLKSLDLEELADPVCAAFSRGP